LYWLVIKHKRKKKRRERQVLFDHTTQIINQIRRELEIVNPNESKFLARSKRKKQAQLRRP